MSATSAIDELRQRAAEEQEAYASEGDPPLASLSAVIVVYSTVVGVISLLIRRSGPPLPERVSLGDVALLSVATH